MLDYLAIEASPGAASLVILNGAVVDFLALPPRLINLIFDFLLSLFSPPVPNSFLLNYIIVYLDKYSPSMVISVVLFSHHPRRFVRFPRNRCVVSISVYLERSRRALDCSSSFVFFNFQPSNLQTFQRFAPNSFPHNSLSDPHPLNPAVSILYKKWRGRGGRLPSRPDATTFSGSNSLER